MKTVIAIVMMKWDECAMYGFCTEPTDSIK